MTHLIDADHYLIGRQLEAKSWEVVNDGTDSLWDIEAGVIARTWDITDAELIGHSINFYDGDDTSGQPFNGLAYGTLGEYGVLVKTLQLVLTKDVLDAAYGATDWPIYLENQFPSYTSTPYPTDFQSIAEYAGYLRDPMGGTGTEDFFYVPTMRAKYDFHTNASDPRGLALASKDPFGNVSTVQYDDYYLLPTITTDALGMQVEAVYDYRLLRPCLITDPNGNRSAVRFSPLGFVVEAGVMGKHGDLDGDVTSDAGSFPVFTPSSIME